MKNQPNPDALFDSTVKRLQQNYTSYRFFKERDIEWTLQLSLWREIENRHLPLAVLENHKMPDGGQVDLAIIQHQTQSVLCVAELKYEPDHLRRDIPAKKFPKVVWNTEVMHNIARLRKLVEAGKTKVGYLLFIDEGSHHAPYHKEGGAQWLSWGQGPYSQKPPAIALTKVPAVRASRYRRNTRRRLLVVASATRSTLTPFNSATSSATCTT